MSRSSSEELKNIKKMFDRREAKAPRRLRNKYAQAAMQEVREYLNDMMDDIELVNREQKLKSIRNRLRPEKKLAESKLKNDSEDQQTQEVLQEIEQELNEVEDALAKIRKIDGFISTKRQFVLVFAREFHDLAEEIKQLLNLRHL